MRIAVIVAIISSLGLSLVSPPAHADSKAWSAAKAGLPTDAKVLIGIDVAALRKTQLFAMLAPRLLEKADAAKTIDTIKTACKLDPIAVIQSVVIATTEDQADGAAYVSLTGIDKARLSSCLVAAPRLADSTAAVTVKHDGNVTQITEGSNTLFIAWIGKDVVVVPFQSKDKAALARWVGGKSSLARSRVGKAVAKVNTSAALWGASDAPQEVQSGVTVKSAYGAVTFSRGNLDADIHAVLDSAAQATTVATTSRQQIDEAKQAILMPPALGAVLKAITITSAHDEVVFKAKVPEADVVSALNLALTMAGQ